MKTELVYTVTAYRWGDRENHSYIVGVYSNEGEAVQVAKETEKNRGGKYECEVLAWEIDNPVQCVVISKMETTTEVE